MVNLDEDDKFSFFFRDQIVIVMMQNRDRVSAMPLWSCDIILNITFYCVPVLDIVRGDMRWPPKLPVPLVQTGQVTLSNPEKHAQATLQEAVDHMVDVLKKCHGSVADHQGFRAVAVPPHGWANQNMDKTWRHDPVHIPKHFCQGPWGMKRTAWSTHTESRPMPFQRCRCVAAKHL